MDLPVMPPVAPMLAQAQPRDPARRVQLRAQVGRVPRHRVPRRRRGRDRQPQRQADRPLLPGGRPAAVRASLPPRCVVDGEIVVPDRSRGRLDFEALQQRIHPAESRVRLLAASTPAHFVGLRPARARRPRPHAASPSVERRRLLEEALGGVRSAASHLTPGDPRPRRGRALVRGVRGRRARRASRTARALAPRSAGGARTRPGRPTACGREARRAYKAGERLAAARRATSARMARRSSCGAASDSTASSRAATQPARRSSAATHTRSPAASADSRVSHRAHHLAPTRRARVRPLRVLG